MGEKRGTIIAWDESSGTENTSVLVRQRLGRGTIEVVSNRPQAGDPLGVSLIPTKVLCFTGTETGPQ